MKRTLVSLFVLAICFAAFPAMAAVTFGGSSTSGPLSSGLIGYTSTTTSAGVQGQSLKFGAVGTNEASFTSPASLAGGASKSMSLWLNASQLRESEQDVAEFGADTMLGTFGIFLNSSNVIAAHLGGTGDFTSTIVPKLGIWAHVVLTYDSGLCSLYVNGQLVATKSQTPNTGTTNFFFGQHLVNAGIFFVGSIDDVCIYNRALSAAEVKFLYNATR